MSCKNNNNTNTKLKKSICLNMIVKNEAHIITETFDNLLQYIAFDYWVISDTGSTDGTQDVIKKYFDSKHIPGELFQDEWKDFGHNRTLALHHANKKTEYLLIFDADDSIHGDFKLPHYSSFNKEMYNLKFGGDNVSYVRPLLIDNTLQWRFNGVLHEFLTCVTKSVQGTLLDGDYFVESGRKGSRSMDPEKYKKDAEILKKAYYTDLEKPDKGLSNRYAFYCAQSYKDCGMVKDAIEWYKLVADKINTWVQEKYYSCFVLGDLYMRQNDFENAIRYLTMSIKFDHERIEGVALACEIFLNKEMFLLCCALGEQFLGHMSPPNDKLFLFEPFYFNHIEYSCSIAGFYCGKYDLGYNCCKKIIITRCIENTTKYIKTCSNLHCYKDQLMRDTEDTIDFFYEYNENIQKLLNDGVDVDPKMQECWNILFEKNRSKLTQIPKNIKSNFNNIIKNASKNKNNNNNNKNNNNNNTNNNITVFISFTTCKRVDLFMQTVGSIMNHWLDKDKIDYWFCVDDNSSRKDRELMQSSFSWINYYMKNENEKGHRESMNIIWNKLNELKPKYWIHMEDDFVFYTKRNYVGDSIQVLEKYHTSKNIRQVLFNRNYSETIENTSTKGHVELHESEMIKGIPVVFHNHNETEKFFFQNCCYWPDYSFRPSMIDVATILELGNYNTENQFFELDYANRWYKSGYRSAFFNMICCRHIGRLTSDRHDKTKPNSYELNNTSQFNFSNSPESVASHHFNDHTNSIVSNEEIRKSYSPPIKTNTSKNIKIVNLKHREDRKINIIRMLESAGFMENEYEIVEAVYGKDLITDPTLELYKMFEGNDFGSRCGFIGCALSHYGLWLELLKDQNNDYYIIIEDDTILCDGFKEYISKFDNDFKEKDILYCGYTMFKNNRENTKDIYDYDIVKNKIDSGRDSSSSDQGQNPSYIPISICPLNRNFHIGGTFGYTINKCGATKLVDYIHKNGIKHGIDYIMKIINTLDCYETQPNLCISLWNEDNVNYDTDIQKYYDVIDFNKFDNYYLTILKEHFIFVERGDQISYDLYHKQDTLKNMVFTCLKDKKCVAFNTLGFFKSHLKEITTSSWFGDNDGLYIKKEYINIPSVKNALKTSEIFTRCLENTILGESKTCEVQQVREINQNSNNSETDNEKLVKMMCDWCSSKELYEEFSIMYKDGDFNNWSNIKLVYDNNVGNHIDYYVIINKPPKDEYYDPKKTIIFQMEPFVYDNTKNWGVKTWGEWASPDPNKFMKVVQHKNELNNVQWQVSPPLQIPGDQKLNKVMCVLSKKLFDEGHQKRVNFLKYIENISVDSDKCRNDIDVYGHENYHELKSYTGKTNNKIEFSKYKYVFSCENNSETNYATEKIWEPILFECLCFYWGCPNLEDYIDSQAFVRLPLNNFEESLSIIDKAIKEDWWSQRIDIIKKEKQKILNELGFFPRLKKIVESVESVE